MLFIPSLVANLLSIAKTMDNRANVHLISTQWRVYYTCGDQAVCNASTRGLLVILDEDASCTAFAASIHVHANMYAWHINLGHLGFDSLDKMARKGLFP